ncbi:MAG TPA: hypothetical protein VHE58_05560 [Burkholderiales bacterium]|nr:hypothetical protein [Burkholderiales bacterium]
MAMENFSKLEPPVRDRLIGHIDRRWRQLYELEKEWGERALKYLFLTNSGGAIATLSFLGAYDKALNLVSTKIALFLFVFGVFLAGVSTAKTFHHMSRLLKEYKLGVEHFYSDKVSWDYLIEEDKKRAEASFMDYAIPYASFGCFVGGSIAGAIALFA